MSFGFNIPLGADHPQLKKDLDAATSVSKQAADRLGADAQRVSDAITTEMKAVGNLSKEFRASQKEVMTLAGKYGIANKATLEAAQIAGEFKNQLSTTNKVIEAYSFDSKFTSVANALQATAGAASIVTGAMGLLGVKSEETQQMMLKVQSALALTQGIAQIKEMGAAWTAMSAVMKTSVIPALATTQGLLIGMGVVGAIGAIIGLAMAFDDAGEEAQEFADSVKNAEQAQKDYNASVAAARDKNLNLRDKQIRNMKEGYDKEVAIVENAKMKEIAAAKKEFEESNQNYLDRNRLVQSQIAIEEYYQQQLYEVRKKWGDKRTAYQKEHDSVKLNTQIQTLGMGSASKMLEESIKNDLKSFKLSIEIPIKIDPKVEFSTSWVGITRAKFETALQELNTGLKSAMMSTIVPTAAMFGTWFATAMLDGYKNPFEALQQMILGQLGDLMVAIGTQFVLFGSGFAKFQAAVFSGNALGAIAAGALMIAAGAAIKTLSQAGLSRNTAGGGGGGSDGSPTQRTTVYAGGEVKPMASGGLLFGPTNVMAAEYTGASNNPEVFAPLNKLVPILQKSMGGSGGGGSFTFMQRGRDLVTIVDQSRKIRNRL